MIYAKNSTNMIPMKTLYMTCVRVVKTSNGNRIINKLVMGEY